MQQYWHMQIHPSDLEFGKDNVHEILEKQQVIGLGGIEDWPKGESYIRRFCDEMNVNDIVAIKNGGKLIALVQVIGGAYQVHDGDWMVNRRPIRILDWEIEEKDLPHTRDTLVRCVNDVATTQVIKQWHERVVQSLLKRGMSVTV